MAVMVPKISPNLHIPVKNSAPKMDMHRFLNVNTFFI